MKFAFYEIRNSFVWGSQTNVDANESSGSESGKENSNDDGASENGE